MDLSNLLKILPTLSNLGAIEDIIKLFNSDDNAFKNITWLLNSLKNGDVSISELLPALLPLLLQFLSSGKGNDDKKENAIPDNDITFSKPLGIEPIQNICDEKTLESLASYLDNVTAS